MDAFYVSVEQRGHSELCGKPLAVGHAEEQGIVATASYETCRYRVCSTMPSQKAERSYPRLVFAPGWMDIYKSIFHRTHEIFHEYTDLIKLLSSDEVSLDATENKQGILLAVDIARATKQRTCEELSLAASVGASYNKFLVRIALDFRKSNGLCIIHSGQVFDFTARLPIELPWGVGSVTARKMHLLGIHNGPQPCGCSSEMLVRQFGKVGPPHCDFARGTDLRPVEVVWIRKSIGREHTLEKDIHVKSAVTTEPYRIATGFVGRLQRKDLRGKTPMLKIKFHDFSQITRSMTQAQELTSLEKVLLLAKQPLKEVEYEQYPTRLTGFSVLNPGEKINEHRGAWG